MTAAKRKSGVRRYPGGQIHHADRTPKETPDEAKATALEARVRRVLGVEAWMAARGSKDAMSTAKKRVEDQLLGSALGRLLYIKLKDRDSPDGISKHQFAAGTYFGHLYRARMKIAGIPSPNVRAIDYGATAPGFSIHPEDSAEYVADIKRRWEEMYRNLYELRMGDVFEVLKRVLIEDKDCTSQEEVGALRIGLNAINKARGV